MDDFSPQGSKEREDGEIQATPNNNNRSSYNHEERREGEDNGWKIVDRRRRKAHTKQETTTSYFFTDIPPGWNEFTLWKTFAKFESYKSDDDQTMVQDEPGDRNDDNNEEDDDDYLDDDDFDVDLMLDNEHGVIGDLSGGWIRNESPLKEASPRSSEFDNIRTLGNGHEVRKDNILVPGTLFEEKSPLELQTIEMEKTRDVALDSEGAYGTSRDQRCNTRLINAITSNTFDTNLEATKTVDVGSTLGYNMMGKEHEIIAIIGDNIGNDNYDFAIQKSDGNSGGIIAIWDNSLFNKSKVINSEDGFLAIYGDWKNIGFHSMFIVLGDFNEVRFEYEQLGSKFCKLGARRFNEFISKSGLIDLPMANVEALETNAETIKLEDHEISNCLSYFKQLDDLEHIKRLDLMQKAKIKWAIEDKKAVWSCGGGKAPWPDGFTFKFIKKYWDAIGIDFINMVKRFEIDGEIPRGLRFSRLEVLGSRSRANGFSDKWKQWINGCLDSGFSSVLVNGSPTKDFKVQKGLRQGDPLSLFLFIIAVEALHISLQVAKERNIFEGIEVGHNKIDISHLQFADDALII
ncbi:RNA-directed DNA polymerase, eukaryota [Tanacetum coccineum]